MTALLITLVLHPGQKPRSPVQLSPKTTFQAIYNKMYAAFNKRDTAGMLAFFSPDFSTSGRRGTKMGLEQVRGSLNATLKLAKDIKGGAAVQSATVAGSSATVVVKLTVHLTAVDPRNNTEIKRSQETVSRDEWAKSGGKWLLKSQAPVSARPL